MADREKSARGRKRGPKPRTAPSATDLFDSLFNQAQEPPAKQSRHASDQTNKDNESDDRSAEHVNSGDSRSQSAGEASEDEEPCVLMSFAGQEETSFENSPQKDKDKRPKRKSQSKVRDTSPEIDDVKAAGDQQPQDSQEDAGKPQENAKVSDAEMHAEESSQSDSKAGINESELATLGVSKDVEDSIRQEIEAMLANNRFRTNGNKDDDDDEEPSNGFVCLEEDTTLVISKLNKKCRFLIRKQEDQTPPCTRDYRCSNCSWSTTRMSNMIRHYKDCLN
ncbi:uncharacterized protein LOC100898793 [Galendromus occidentalis]|uniref:Uncharacterized protein LOC100898793 n=1 Tax=Galendromus occidentalis TaxID=34638 RepID=A0AAJ6QU08_9ACAR|nr:uncharacterized protein LOC100898793 [Galendromus occidentalis]